MTQQFATVRDHYQGAITNGPAILAAIERHLDQLDGPLTAQRLASFDQFHVGGLAATPELARRAAIHPDMRILDAGSGLGGPSRFLAETRGVTVNGVDLAPAYVDVARLLARRSGLEHRVQYHAGSITELKFDDETFDLVWTQHVVMNIADREALYRELRRVLKPGGKFAFYDPYAPDIGEPAIYPTPWAQTAEQSTLLTKAQTIAAMSSAGFAVPAWEDVTALGREWIAVQAQQLRGGSPPAAVPALSPGLVVGQRMGPMVANFARNLLEGRVLLVMGLAETA